MNSTDYFANLLGSGSGGKGAAPKKHRTTVVTPATITRVREEQAADAFAAERASLNKALESAKEELAAQEEASESLARDLALAREELAQTKALLEERDARLAESVKRQADLEHKAADAINGRNVAVAERDAAVAERNAAIAERDAARTAAGAPPDVSSSVLLDKPNSPSEKFPGEIREHVIEAIADASKAAEAAGRERRARVLEAVLYANSASGELPRRRELLKQIMKDAGSFLDDTTISELEKLGFRYISGKNHHKLEWAGIRFPVAKTPGDRRSCLNSAADISNRVF